MSTNAVHTINEERPKKRRGVTILKDARIDAISLVDVGANNHRFFLFKRATDFVDIDGNLIHVEPREENVDKILPLFKGDTDESGNWRTAYCVVAVPDEVDQQEDVWPHEEVRKSAHEFLKNGALINYMHKDLSKIGDTVESYIAPIDMQIGEQKIIAGSWIIGIEPFDQVKQEIEKGYITGVSVQGTSRRIAMEKNAPTMPVSPNAMAATVPAAAPVENQSSGENAKNQRRIPIGAEGPGIKKLQHLLGVPETGIYDQVTELAFVEFLMRQGVEPEPTVQAMQDVLKQIEDSAAGAAALDTTPAVSPKTAVEAAPAPVEKDSMPSQYVGSRIDEHGRGTMTVTGPVPGTTTHVNVRNNPTSGATSDTSVTVPDLKAIVEGDSNDPEDLKVALYLAAKRGNDDLMNHLNTVHGIKEPEEIFTAPFDLEHLKLMVKVFILGDGELGDEDADTGNEGAGVSAQVEKAGDTLEVELALEKLATEDVAVIDSDDLSNTDKSILNRIVSIFKSSKTTEETAEETRQLFDDKTVEVEKAIGITNSNATEQLDAAMRGLMVGMSDALKNKNKDEQLSDLDYVLSDFSKWAEDYNDEIIEKNAKETMEKAKVDVVVSADNPAKPSVPKIPGTLIGKWVTVNGKRGKVLTQFGTALSIKLEDGTTIKAEVKDVKVENANPTHGGKMEDVAKAAIDLDEERKARIIETRAFLDELLGETETSAEANTEVEKTEENEQTADEVNETPEAEATTEVVDTEVAVTDEVPETTLNDVILFVNRLADQVETVSKSIEETNTLTEKVEELAKRADVSETLAGLKAELDELKESLVPATAQVEEVNKRLQAVENTAGTRTSEPVNEVRETVNKSATSSAWTGRF